MCTKINLTETWTIREDRRAIIPTWKIDRPNIVGSSLYIITERKGNFQVSKYAYTDACRRREGLLVVDGLVDFDTAIESVKIDMEKTSCILTVGEVTGVERKGNEIVVSGYTMKRGN